MDIAKRLRSVLHQAVKERYFPGAVSYIAKERETIEVRSGKQTYDSKAPCTTLDTIYDLASITKVVATTTAVMQLIQKKDIRLDDRVCKYFPEFVGGGKENISIKELLTHTSGLPGPAPLYKNTKNKQELIDAIFSISLEFSPGEKRLYDDLGFILLGLIVEKITGQRLDKYCIKNIFAPLGMTDTTFLPAQELKLRIAPTEIDESTGKILHGVVHDEKARMLGGVAGHAGLFSNVKDLNKFGQMLLNRGIFEGIHILEESIVDTMLKVYETDRSGKYSFGWEKCRESYMDGIDDEDVFGHTGFTGTSIVISPKYRMVVILLTNRVNPYRYGPSIDRIRKEVANIAFSWAKPKTNFSL